MKKLPYFMSSLGHLRTLKAHNCNPQLGDSCKPVIISRSKCGKAPRSTRSFSIRPYIILLFSPITKTLSAAGQFVARDPRFGNSPALRSICSY